MIRKSSIDEQRVREISFIRLSMDNREWLFQIRIKFLNILDSTIQSF